MQKQQQIYIPGCNYNVDPKMMETMKTILLKTITEYSKLNKNEKIEIEMRFGRMTDQGFQTGVTLEFFDKVVQMLEGCEKWYSTQDWTVVKDSYFFGYEPNSPMIRTASKIVRHSDQSCSIVPEHIRKYMLFKQNIRCHYHAAAAWESSSEGFYDIRLSVNKEETVDAQQLPAMVNTERVRFKNRKSFFYKSDSFPAQEPLWRFDVTCIAQGNTRQEAELNFRHKLFHYEIELECLNPRAILRNQYPYDEMYVAYSMFLKMRDLGVGYHHLKKQQLPVNVCSYY